MTDYTIVTICDRVPHEPYYCLPQFFKSLNNHPILVLDGSFDRFHGLGSKPKMLYKAIKENVIKTKLTIFCDCWDLVFATTPEEIIETWQAFSSGLVISSEKNCFPADLKEYYDAWPGITSSYKYLNSGFIVGETDALLACLESMDLPNVPYDYWDAEKQCNIHINDQFLWQQTFVKQPAYITLDYDQLLCNTLHQVKVDELDFSKERIRNKETGSYPCAWHMNGSAKTDGLREPILKHLNLL